ncbi:MAG: ATP-dependent carboxylate-amine ligase, partial [Alphaproteobacteria bacterium]
MADADRSRPYFLRVLEELCPAHGATLQVDPEFGYCGHIVFADGRRSPFLSTSFDVNGQGAAAIARDKHYCRGVLAGAGLPVPDEVLVFSEGYRTEFAHRNPALHARLAGPEAAHAFAAAHGFPLIVKPNASAMGRGVFKVADRAGLDAALADLSARHTHLLVQRFIAGRDYRVLVFDGRAMIAYERAPLAVTGDGNRTIRTLLAELLAAREAAGRGNPITNDDPRIAGRLAEQGWTPDSIPPAGDRVALLPTANLSSGGEPVDVTGCLAEPVRNACISAARAIGLTAAGVDVIADDATQADTSFVILEVNGAPGLAN